MIIQHLLLFVCLCFIIGRKPKPNYRKRSRAYEAAYRRPESRTLGADSAVRYQKDSMVVIGLPQR